MDVPEVHVVGKASLDPALDLPLTVTFNPAGCGQVLYSGYHVSDHAHAGLNGQDRLMTYMLMNMGECPTSTP